VPIGPRKPFAQKLSSFTVLVTELFMTNPSNQFGKVVKLVRAKHSNDIRQTPQMNSREIFKLGAAKPSYHLRQNP
jgi:hypothetical protein